MQSQTEDHNAVIDTLDLSEVLPGHDALACLAPEIASRHQVLPVAIVTENNARVLLLACADAADQALKERMRMHVCADYLLRFVSCADTQLLPAIAEFYRLRHEPEKLIQLAIAGTFSNSSIASGQELPVEFVNALLIEAAEARASDIHVCPESGGVHIRLRVDGVLRHLASISQSLFSSLLIRIKIMASLDIAETRYPQDGQFRRVINGRAVDFRVSTFPTVDGENTVLRLIDKRVQHQTVRALCLPEEIERRLTAIMNKPEGLVVVCGPTGAGKSTTLFALLNNIDCRSRSVMTLEDPVEQRLTGIRQTTIDASRQWGYAQGIKAVLRQDPDVLLIGEIRDSESCRMVFRAVSTGHQVLTTVHAADAHSALHRLRELDASGAAMACGLVAVIAQRLVRRCCIACTGSDQDCSSCHGTGYAGRQVIVELLEFTEETRTLLTQGAGIESIRQVNRNSGFENLHEQAMRLVANGVTTQEEVKRVLGDYEQ